MLLYNTVHACGGRYDNCKVVDVDDFSLNDSSFWDNSGKLINPILIHLCIVIIISFIVTLGFYLVYKYKKDEHPWKHAFKRSRPRWIIIFVLLISAPIIIFLSDNLNVI